MEIFTESWGLTESHRNQENLKHLKMLLLDDFSPVEKHGAGSVCLSVCLWPPGQDRLLLQLQIPPCDILHTVGGQRCCSSALCYASQVYFSSASSISSSYGDTCVLSSLRPHFTPLRKSTRYKLRLLIWFLNEWVWKGVWLLQFPAGLLSCWPQSAAFTTGN